jgi:hypothetical protein
MREGLGVVAGCGIDLPNGWKRNHRVVRSLSQHNSVNRIGFGRDGGI